VPLPAREIQRPAGEHLLAHDRPRVGVVRIGLLAVVDFEDPAEVDQVSSLPAAFVGGELDDADMANLARGYLDRVIELDALNPQVAARMARGFDRWKKFDAGRQARARAALERIRDAQSISKGVLEIATRALA